MVIQLAFDLDILSILPAALYDLSRYGPSKILAGTHPLTSAFSILTSQPKPETPPPAITLGHAILCRTYRGREASQRFMANFVARELQARAPSPDCAHKSDEIPSRLCHESFYFIMLNLLRSIGGVACGRDADPLFMLDQATDMLTRTDFSDGTTQCGLKLCDPCKRDFAGAVANAREEAWRVLPGWFGFQEGYEGGNSSVAEVHKR